MKRNDDSTLIGAETLAWVWFETMCRGAHIPFLIILVIQACVYVCEANQSGNVANLVVIMIVGSTG